jgi:hypothetical protein
VVATSGEALEGAHRSSRDPRQPTPQCSAVDGLITGWHDAGASHLLQLEAVASPDLVSHGVPGSGRARISLASVWRQRAPAAGAQNSLVAPECETLIVRGRTRFQRIRIAVQLTPATHCHALPVGGR